MNRLLLGKLMKLRFIHLPFDESRPRDYFRQHRLKVSQFQNELMKLSFLPKYEQKIVRISALCSEGRNFGRNDDFINSF